MGESQSTLSEEPRRPTSYAEKKHGSPWQNAGIYQATIFDYYEIDRLLGSGSFGQVRQCWPLHQASRSESRDDKTGYAVKIVDSKGEVFKQAAAHLSARQEANILKSLQHPHIVKLVDIFDQERWIFLVLENITGGELFSALANPKTNVTESCVATVGRQLLQALHHLHERFIVHRDVKAENILLLHDPAEAGKWHIKLIDFGLALRIEQPSCFFRMSCREQAPLEELICGTAYYCAPEVWVNDYGPKVDVWAAGVVMYLALMGAFPFYMSDPNQLEAIICDSEHLPSYEPITASGTLGYQVSSEAKACLQALLTKDHEERPDVRQAKDQPWFRGAHFKAHSFSQQRSVSMSSECYLLSTGDQTIPVPVRAKAARCARRPTVDVKTELSRTSALEAMKARAQNESVTLLRKNSKLQTPGSDGTTSNASTASRTAWRDLAVSTNERQSRSQFTPYTDRLDQTPAEPSTSDSDVEDDGPTTCVCTRNNRW